MINKMVLEESLIGLTKTELWLFFFQHVKKIAIRKQ